MDEMAKEARKRLLDRKKVIEALIAGVEARAQTNELSELEAALERIEKGAYGTCMSCGGAVGRQRLRAIPEARFCIDCVSTRSRRAVAS